MGEILRNVFWLLLMLDGFEQVSFQVGLADAFGKLGDAVVKEGVFLLALTVLAVVVLFVLVLAFLIFVVVLWARWRAAQ